MTGEQTKRELSTMVSCSGFGSNVGALYWYCICEAGVFGISMKEREGR